MVKWTAQDAFRGYALTSKLDRRVRIGAAYMRANNAGKPLWWGLIAGIPIVSLVAVIYLLIIPSKHVAPAVKNANPS